MVHEIVGGFVNVERLQLGTHAQPLMQAREPWQAERLEDVWVGH